MNTTVTRTTALAALLLGGLSLAACAGSEAPAATPAGDDVWIEDAWIKAADEGMSAGFGLLFNSGDADATVVSATTDAADRMELHETVESETGEMLMREIDGGFAIPAGSGLELAPGGSHLMLMDLTGPLEAGDEVSITLTFDDDSTYSFDAPVKDYSGANEEYGDGHDHSEMDHG
ncbi:copper chaperone PCu(A)C [Microbacterium karelineae]|uniref:copper chaperone PCu(A)C n=1 Tax=Microbacterium karelineae TaxID=2654283 RepID=UPI0012EAEDF8|nr:copper chaperone PCu(A)C [Microbacterium karelineae]